MSDSRNNENRSIDNLDTFQEWVSHTANTRDVDEQDLLNQLVSAFWVLNEMADVASDTPVSELTTKRHEVDDRTAVNESVERREETQKETDEREQGNRPELGRRPNNTRDDLGAAHGKTDDSANDESDESTEDEDSPRDADGVDPAVQEVQALRDSIQTQFEMVQTVNTLRRQVDDLSLDVEKQRSTQDQFTDRIADDLTRIHNRIEQLESDESGDIDHDTINALESNLSAEIDRVEAELTADIERTGEEQDALKSWIDEEFDEIEGLFKRLLDTTQSVERRVDEIESEVDGIENEIGGIENEIGGIKSMETDRKRLKSLRQDAAAAGISTGRCEACDSTVDLSMLDEPTCPHCATEFESIETNTSSWNPFSKPTIRTADTRMPPDEFTDR